MLKKLPPTRLIYHSPEFLKAMEALVTTDSE